MTMGQTETINFPYLPVPLSLRIGGGRGMETETLRFMMQAWECDHLGHVNVRSYMG